jgi:hypothetical protein
MNIYVYMYASMHIHMDMYQTYTYVDEFTFMHGYIGEFICTYTYTHKYT